MGPSKEDRPSLGNLPVLPKCPLAEKAGLAQASLDIAISLARITRLVKAFDRTGNGRLQCAMRLLDSAVEILEGLTDSTTQSRVRHRLAQCLQETRASIVLSTT